MPSLYKSVFLAEASCVKPNRPQMKSSLQLLYSICDRIHISKLFNVECVQSQKILFVGFNRATSNLSF